MLSIDMARHAAFVTRCAAAATLALLLAEGLHFPFPVWAAISAIIVSQERLSETTSATLARVGGTLLGIVVAVAVGTVMRRVALDTPWQMLVAVAVCAAISRKFPQMRVSMWTVPIVFLSGAAGQTMLDAGLWRGAEVLVGALVGAAVHGVAELIMVRLFGIAALGGPAASIVDSSD